MKALASKKEMAERSKRINIHEWLRLHYGPARKCENLDCPFKGERRKYQWALIRNRKYEKRRENFKQLCYGCHRTYDHKLLMKKQVPQRGSRTYNAIFMREKRRKFRALYVAGKIAYKDIPVSYRYFTDSKKKKI